ncbi:hypothetical protein [Streptomyces sp. NPDC006645]|uniref:hypothetical protein n=1 Tax=unclassified Streptomyces TaxID=2593676 RepID=UPI0033B71AAA
MRLKIAGLLGLVLAAGSLTMGSTTAVADPIASCNTWKSNSAPWSGSANCTGLGISDTFRVKVTCIDSRGTKTVLYGPWKRNHQTSTKKCSDNPNVGVYKAGYELGQ